MNMTYEFIINHGGKLQMPLVESGITWSTERKGRAGRLQFSVVNDGKIAIEEGDAVRFKANGSNVFYGFVFSLDRSKDGIIGVTAYDQIIYLTKNKYTFQYSGKTATQVISMLANDFQLKCGTMESTGYTIESRIEDNQTLYDMTQNALDITLTNTGKLYILYDDFGKLALKSLSNMKVSLLIDDETAENFNYQTSIEGSYNKIKLAYDNQSAGKRELYISQDGSNMNKWGTLQYFESLSSNTGAKAKADALLKLYNNRNTSLTIRRAFGDTKVRAGSLVMVQLDLGDTVVKSYLMVETCTHRFGESEHWMDLVLTGGSLK